MLRADNMTVVVLALQERGGAPLPMHQDEVVVDLAAGSHRATPYTQVSSAYDNGCKVRQVGTSLVQCFSGGVHAPRGVLRRIAGGCLEIF